MKDIPIWQTAHLKFLEDMEQVVQEKLDRLAFDTIVWEEERVKLIERKSMAKAQYFNEECK